MPTAQSIKEEIEKHRSEIYKKDYTFFEVDTLYKCAVCVEHESSECAECASMLDDMQALAAEYPRMLNNGSSGRSEYEKRLSKYLEHLRKAHGYTRKGFFQPVYMALGLVVGLLAGLVIGHYTACMGVGLVAGYIAGAVRDRKAEKNGKTL
ncbi:MAG: hypothetical protein J6V76_00735 [Bacteroidales bacterium]|nr:hypothetical protein [Bacteroidales bacterium]MBO7141626.1 hypothetical protein [Bacteroidales bacterium]